MARPTSRRQSTIPVWVAVVTVIGSIVVAVIHEMSKPPDEPASMPAPTPPQSLTSTGSGRLVGTLTDRSGNPLNGMAVSIRNGPQALTDAQGVFVLSEINAGDQWITVKPPSGRSNLTQNITIESNRTIQAKIVYDANHELLGLLSITAPVDSGLIEVHPDGSDHRATVFGRCDGLPEMLDTFDIWVLVKSNRDSRFWVQHPAAVVDRGARTWHTSIMIGSPENPPRSGEYWDFVAVAASADSDIARVINTPRLSQLPPHISSNVVMAEIKIER